MLKRLALIILLSMTATLVPFWGANASETGIASWYSDTRTASGQKFNPRAMTCAHKKLPFGTLVTVTGANGITIVCKVNDRGPYVRGRIIDLTHEGARRLGLLQRGLMKVTLSI